MSVEHYRGGRRALITFRGQMLQSDWTATIVAEVQVIGANVP